MKVKLDSDRNEERDVNERERQIKLHILRLSGHLKEVAVLPEVVAGAVEGVPPDGQLGVEAGGQQPAGQRRHLVVGDVQHAPVLASQPPSQRRLDRLQPVP